MSSLLKLATMDESDLLRVNPAEMRVRVSLVEPYQLVQDQMQLVLAFEYKDGSQRHYDFALELKDSDHSTAISSWFANEPARNIYTFQLGKLSQLEYNRFKRTQQLLKRPQSYRWQVNYWLDPLPDNNSAIGLDLELKLGREKAYFYLLKNAQMKVEVK